jgi:hypothetical protein
MRLVRVWLPVAIIAAGIAMIVATNASETGIEGGALLVSAGLSVWLLNWLFRLGVRGDRERESEDRARAYFDRHGRWPDDPQPAREPSDDRHGHAPDGEPLDSGHGRHRRR